MAKTMQSALARWHELHDARAQQMDAAYARLGRTSADFWQRRAGGFHRATRDSALQDPFFQRVRAEVSSENDLLDVGAGTGRFTLALAPFVSHIVAVEPSDAMLKYLQQETETQGLTNISYQATTWQAAPDTLQADIVICSHVLYPIREVDQFLKKLYAATRQTCYLYMRATPIDALSAHLWQYFHGEERIFSPSYIHALDILFELDLYADVEIVRTSSTLHFASLDDAVEEMLEMLILPDTRQTRQELRLQLEQWLVPQGAEFVPPQPELVSAILKLSRSA
ncbi:MAG TPA: class I SAM-dependent methyltransferase [Ktedonobacteraceae bacterium]|nr:class I SAM-dependent methyltransferase [Ktedonobacteraceae bacterium]